MEYFNSPREKFRSLTSSRTILPSLLACDFANLERDIHELEESGASALHLDIMDGHFVPNLSFGIPVVEAVRRVTDLVLDVHLMLSTPESYFEVFKNAGADGITFHAEALADLDKPNQNFARNGCRVTQFREIETVASHIHSALDKIHTLGLAAGLSIIPPSDVEILEPFLCKCENILIMSVMPGFGGQKFDPRAKEKLSWLHNHVMPGTLISVDGGVNENTLADCKNHGATGLVMGTAIFKNNQTKNNFVKLNNELQAD
ncbi:MAG: ribulose-phosphate 3-epimerase [Planctomycetia bacterium]|nr:ribulose-phosphate 3-epimerase [Planctomycetia bacterium]